MLKMCAYGENDMKLSYTMYGKYKIYISNTSSSWDIIIKTSKYFVSYK